jgi:hypothetical protein
MPRVTMQRDEQFAFRRAIANNKNGCRVLTHETAALRGVRARKLPGNAHTWLEYNGGGERSIVGWTRQSASGKS